LSFVEFSNNDFQVPKSDHPNEDGITKTLSAFSKIPLSTEMNCTVEYSSLISFVPSLLKRDDLILVNESNISGKCCCKESIIDFAFQTKIPALYIKSTNLMKASAYCIVGFSVNVLTFLISVFSFSKY